MFVLEWNTRTNFSNFRCRLRNMFSQISFCLPSLFLCSLFTFSFRTPSKPIFSEISSAQVHRQLLVFYISVILPHLGEVKHFPSIAPVVAAWWKSLHLFPCNWWVVHSGMKRRRSTFPFGRVSPCLRCCLAAVSRPHVLPTTWKTSSFSCRWRWLCKPVPIPFS